MIISSVTHHVPSNTLEVVWQEIKTDEEGTPISYERVRCQSYSSDQKSEFVADTGESKYVELVGW